MCLDASVQNNHIKHNGSSLALHALGYEDGVPEINMPQTTLLGYLKSPGISAAPRGPPTPAASGESKLPRIVQALNHASLNTSNDIFHNPPDSPFNYVSSTDSEQIYNDTIDNTHAPDIPRVAILSIHHSHLPALQRLTSTLLPVRYPDKFFSGAVEELTSASFSRVALYDSKPIGWIRCRLDPFPEPTSPPSNTKPIYNQIYIQALCLLAPHRGCGVATALLDTILRPKLLRDHDVECVYAHVWETNLDALAWYERRGFRRVELVKNYYTRIRPGGAWIVKRDLR